MLSYISGVDDREMWVKMAYILADEYGEAGFDVWDTWSQQSDSYNFKDSRAVWKSCMRPSGGATAKIGSLVALAVQAGYRSNGCAKPVDPAERERIAAERAERLAREAAAAERDAAEAAELAATIWTAAVASGHPYLTRKQVEGYGTRVAAAIELPFVDDETGEIGTMTVRNALLIPVYQGPRHLCGLQYITADGKKLPIRGTPMRGGYMVIGRPVRGGVVVICEGWATGASIHAATGYCVVVAFNAGNLKHVAAKIRAAMPDAEIIIAADDDAFTDGNPGLRAANSAASEVGGTVALPMWAGDREQGTDFNDLHCAEGMTAVRMCFEDPQQPEDDGPGQQPDDMPEPPPYYDEIPPSRDDRAPVAMHDPIDIFAEFPVPPIARDMLPAAITDYAFDQAALVGVDPAMIAIPALVTCAAALHDDLQIQPMKYEKGWTESARLWCAVVGAPSVKKTPSIKRATRRLRKLDIDLHATNSAAQAQYIAQSEQWKEDKKDAKKSGAPMPAAPEAPKNERLVVEDATVEALAYIMKDNTRGLLCIQDELSGWFGAMDVYSGGKGGGSKDRAFHLQCYNGGPKLVDRIGRGSTLVPNTSYCMIGGIQPDAIRRIAQNMTDDGLMQRFMIIIGKNAPENDRPEDDSAVRAYRDLVDHLYAISAGGDRVVLLSADAQQVRIRMKAFETELVDYPALPGGLRSHIGKWSGLFARLCLIFHAIECAGARAHPLEYDVSGDTAERVERLMREYLLPHALAYYTDILGAAGDLEHSRWIAGHILSKKLETVTNRDLLRAYKQWRGLDDFRRQRITESLCDMGWMTPVGDAARSKRGAHTWAINARVHEVFAAKAAAEAERRERIRIELQNICRNA